MILGVLPSPAYLSWALGTGGPWLWSFNKINQGLPSLNPSLDLAGGHLMAHISGLLKFFIAYLMEHSRAIPLHPPPIQYNPGPLAQ